jgi:hypothetical protein
MMEPQKVGHAGPDNFQNNQLISTRTAFKPLLTKQVTDGMKTSLTHRTRTTESTGQPQQTTLVHRFALGNTGNLG